MGNQQGKRQALHSAASLGDIHEIVRLVEEQNVKVDLKDRWGYTALLKAAEKGYVDCVLRLVTAGAKFDRQSKWCQTSALTLAAENGHVDCVEVLLQCGCDPNQTDKFSNTPLHKAVAYEHQDCVRTLLEAGADVNKCNNYNCTPVSMAARNGSTKLLEMLLAVPGCDTNIPDVDGCTAILLASRWGHLECVELLLSHRAAAKLMCEEIHQGHELMEPFQEALSRRQISGALLIMKYALRIDLDNTAIQESASKALITMVNSALHSPIVSRSIHFFVLKMLAIRQYTSLPVTTASLEKVVELVIRGTDITTLTNFYGKDLLFNVALEEKNGKLIEIMSESGQTWTRYHINSVNNSEEEFSDGSRRKAMRRSQIVGYMSTEEVPSLLQLSRSRIRLQLGYDNLSGVASFDIPSSLKDYLLLRDSSVLKRDSSTSLKI